MQEKSVLYYCRGDKMDVFQAACEDAEPVFQLVQNTIQSIYPNYYKTEIVDFFLSLHSREAISQDIAHGRVFLLQDGPRLVGTGTVRKNHITRVFVAPDAQRMGYGNQIMEWLERIIFDNYDKVYLDASLPAGRFYDQRGYRTVRHELYPLKDGVVLAYEVMEKTRGSV